MERHVFNTQLWQSNSLMPSLRSFRDTQTPPSLLKQFHFYLYEAVASKCKQVVNKLVHPKAQCTFYGTPCQTVNLLINPLCVCVPFFFFFFFFFC